MQANLCRFANAFASRMALPTWRVEPNTEIPGGRVIVSEATDFLNEVEYEELAELNGSAGNLPVDMLFCVPSSLVNSNDSDSFCGPAQDFIDRDLKIWDGTRRSSRKVPALDNDQHRFVHYESCRGLEGWITVLYRFDELFEEKVRIFSEQEDNDGGGSRAVRRAVEWLMIPLTRCIDTLVIHVEDPNSEIAVVLKELAGDHKDFVEWRNDDQAPASG